MKFLKSVKLISVAIFCSVVSLVIFLLLQIPRLNTSYSIDQFFPKEHPLITQDQHVRKIFGLEEVAMLYVTASLPGEENWLTPKNMHRLSEITNQIANLPGVSKTISLATVEMALSDDHTLKIGPVFETLPPEKWQAYTKQQALLRPQLLSQDEKSALIVIEPSVDTPAEIQHLQSALHLELKKNAPVEFGVGGIPAIQSRLSEIISSEVIRFMGLSLLTFCFVFFLFYKNFSPVLFCFLGLLTVNITTMGWLAVLGTPFTVLLSTLPIITSIAFVSISIHTLHLWADRLKVSQNLNFNRRFYLSLLVLRELTVPNLLGSLTTAIGFIVLVFTPIPIIKSYAITIAISVLWVWFISHFILIIAQPLMQPQQRSWTNIKAFWMLKVTRWRRPILIGLVGIAVYFVFQGRNINFEGRLFDDLPKRESVRTVTEKIDNHFGGIVAYNVTLETQDVDKWKKPEELKKLKKLLTDIREINGVGSAISVTDFLDKIPATQAGVAESLFLFSMANQNPINPYLSNDFRSLRLAVRFHDFRSDILDKSRSEIRNLVSQAFPDTEVLETGLAVNGHVINRDISKELVLNFWHSLALVGFMLIFVFKSIRWALVACLPNFLPPAILVGSMALMGTTIKPSIALIFSIALGLAFNNTMYILSRMRRKQIQKKMYNPPLRYTLLEEGNPCLSESALMMTGFLIFLASRFQINQTFGAYMVISIIAGAVGDLVFLPALLRQFPQILRGRPNTSAAMVIFFLLIFVPMTGSSANMSASDILNKSKQQLESTSDSANVTLKIIEPNGDIKSRQLYLQTLHEGSTFHALARIDAPADVKGTALLVQVKEGNEEQWLYLPSNKQVRRVVSGKKSVGVLGSELSPEDLNADAVKGAKAQLISKNDKQYVVEVKPTPGSSEYAKVINYISISNYLPEKMEYFVGAKIKKTLEFKNYTTVSGKSRAQLIEVRNLLNKRGTDVIFQNVKVNPSLSSKDFTPEALKD